MKTNIRLTALAIVALCSATLASAASYTFVDWDLQGSNSYKYLQTGQSYTGLWDISSAPGFSSSLNFTSAKADLWFSDDSQNDVGEYVTIDLGLTSGWRSDIEVDGQHTNPYSLSGFDLVTGGLSASLLLDIATDGKLSYKVKVTSGDTYLKETRLTVYASTRTVPDGASTVALLGLGIVALACFKRRK